jgi:hypothetical protein
VRFLSASFCIARPDKCVASAVLGLDPQLDERITAIRKRAELILDNRTAVVVFNKEDLRASSKK